MSQSGIKKNNKLGINVLNCEVSKNLYKWVLP